MVVQEVLQLLLFFNQMLEFGLSMGMQSCFVSVCVDNLPRDPGFTRLCFFFFSFFLFISFAI